jgi:hypothetical protein
MSRISVDVLPWHRRVELVSFFCKVCRSCFQPFRFLLFLGYCPAQSHESVAFGELCFIRRGLLPSADPDMLNSISAFFVNTFSASGVPDSDPC